MTATATPGAAPALTHPRIQERREAVEDAHVRRRHRRFIVLGVLVLLVLTAALLTRTPLMDVDEVRVIGANAPGLVREVAAIEPGTPLVGLDLDVAAERLLALPRVADVAIEKNWSGVVTVQVVERKPVATIATEMGVLVVADDGLVLAVIDAPDSTLVEIGGAMFSTPVGEHVPEELDDAVAVATALPSDVGRVTDRIIVGADRVGLDLVGGGQIELGDGRDLNAKFDAVRAILGQVQLRCLERVDVRAATVPVLARTPSCR